MSYVKYTKKCRVCGNPHLKNFLHLGPQHIQGAFKTESNNPPNRKIEAIICRCDPTEFEGGCGLVQNRVTIPPEILYSSYFYRSSISKTMRDHLTEISKKVVDLLDSTTGKVIVDIGGNDGFLLNCFDTFCKKILIDPSDIASQVKHEDIHVINECFPTDVLETIQSLGSVDVFSSIACFYDIDSPLLFADAIAKYLASEGIWVCEFAYLPTVFEKLAYDGMVHEHLALYSLSSFEYILDQVGLKVFDLEENTINGGSLQVWVTHKNNHIFDTKDANNRILRQKIKEFDLRLDEEKTYYDFVVRVSKHQSELVALLHKLKQEGKKIHAYGMSTKLNCLLGVSDIGPSIIEAAAERDEAKWGAKTLSGIPIISESESRQVADVYFVGPYHFKKEILEREMHTILKQRKTFIFPLPEITVVNAENYEVVRQSVTP